MHERFSDRARHAMALANREAGRLNHPDLRPAHLMLGLIAEGQCVATEALRLLKVDLERVRSEVSARLGPGDAQNSVGRRAQTEELRAVVAMAIQEARRLDHRYVGTEHLILGLLAHGESIPAAVLRDQGIDLGKLREQTLALLHSESSTGGDLDHLRHGELEWIHQQELAKAFRSPTFWQTLILAVDSANRFGAGEIGSAHVLLALLRDRRSGLAEALAEKGVTEEWLRERLGLGSVG